MAAKNVVFDIGNVFTRWNQRNFYRGVFNDDEKMEYFLKHVCSHEWNLSLDAGVDYNVAVPALKLKFPEWAEYIDLYENGWEKMFGGVIYETVDLLNELKTKKVPVYAITNWSHQKFPRALELFPFLASFDGTIVSGYEKLIKPDPKIYQLLLSRYNLKAEECVFTDDLPENVAAAKTLGFYGHVFTETKLFRDYLQTLGFPV